MPIINVTMNPTTPETKKRLIEKLTDDMASTASVPKECVTVLIREIALDSVGIGGQVLEERRKATAGH